MTGESQLALANKQLYKAGVLKRTKGPRPVCIKIIWPTSPATCFALNDKCPLLTCLMKKSNVLLIFSILWSVTFTVQENMFQTWSKHDPTTLLFEMDPTCQKIEGIVLCYAVFSPLKPPISTVTLKNLYVVIWWHCPQVESKQKISFFKQFWCNFLTFITAFEFKQMQINVPTIKN